MVWNRTVYMYKNGFGINNLQWLMCQQTKPYQTLHMVYFNDPYISKRFWVPVIGFSNLHFKAT